MRKIVLHGLCLILMTVLFISKLFGQVETKFYRHAEIDLGFNLVTRYEIDLSTAMYTNCFKIEYDNQNRPVTIRYMKYGKVLRSCHPEFLEINLIYFPDRVRWDVKNKYSLQNKNLMPLKDFPLYSFDLYSNPDNKNVVLIWDKKKMPKEKMKELECGMLYEFNDTENTVNIFSINKKGGKISDNQTGVFRTIVILEDQGKKQTVISKTKKDQIIISPLTELYRVEYRYDDYGNVSEVYCYDENDLPCPMDESGSVALRIEYDQDGKMTTIYSTLSDSGKVVYQDDYLIYTFLYDKSGNIIEDRMMNSKGQLVADQEGIAVVKYIYDQNGFIISDFVYDNNENLAEFPEGISYAVNEYDECGRLTFFVLHRADGSVYNSTYFWAAGKFIYDENGRIIHQVFYDATSYLNVRLGLLKEDYPEELTPLGIATLLKERMQNTYFNIPYLDFRRNSILF